MCCKKGSFVIVLLLIMCSTALMLQGISIKENKGKLISNNLCCYLLGYRSKCRLRLKRMYIFKLSFNDFKNGKLTILILDSLDYDDRVILGGFNSFRFEQMFIKEVCIVGDSICIVDDSTMITVIISLFYNRLTKSIFYNYYIKEYRHILEECVRIKLPRRGVWYSDLITKRVAPIPSLHFLPNYKDKYKELWEKILEQ